MSTATTTVNSEFVLARTYQAPPARVFTAWTDAACLAQWWGPGCFTNPICEMDARPGGSYRIVMRGPEGTDYPMFGQVLSVNEPRELAWTVDLSENPASWHDLVFPARGANPNPAGAITLRVLFEPTDGGTTVTIREQFESPEILGALLATGMTEGWSESLDRLGKLVNDL